MVFIWDTIDDKIVNMKNNTNEIAQSIMTSSTGEPEILHLNGIPIISNGSTTVTTPGGGYYNVYNAYTNGTGWHGYDDFSTWASRIRANHAEIKPPQNITDIISGGRMKWSSSIWSSNHVVFVKNEYRASLVELPIYMGDIRFERMDVICDIYDMVRKKIFDLLKKEINETSETIDYMSNVYMRDSYGSDHVLTIEIHYCYKPLDSVILQMETIDKVVFPKVKNEVITLNLVKDETGVCIK